MDLLDDHRSLLHTGKLLARPDQEIAGSWTELLGILFDNYCRRNLFSAIAPTLTGLKSRPDQAERQR